MKRHHQSSIAGATAGTSTGGRPALRSGGTPTDQKADMDELLAVLGYKVRSSDMAEVAEKLEKLEMAMDTAEENDILHLSTDAVHYNPSDLSSWLHSMLGELHLPSGENSIQEPVECSDVYDLSAIPGDALCSNKRFKPSSSSDTASKQVVMVDSQETGVRLVHTLLACAEAVDQGDMKIADALVKQVGLLASAQAGAMRKVAIYFAEALARRIYNIFPRDSFDSCDMLQMHFYDVSPYLKFAHFTANQAILEALSSAERVHVIDFGANQGLQWPALMQALSLRAEGPPTFRLTVIAEVEDDDSLNPIGMKLADLARIIGIQFEFNRLPIRSFDDLEHSLLDLRPNEEVAINAVFELHRLLSISGAIEKMLSSIKVSYPKIVTVVEQEANNNGPAFLDRFNQALHYYSAFFDSLEGSVSGQSGSAEVVMAEMYLGRQICNVVACEGLDRVERHEPLSQWRMWFESAGFCPVHIGSNAFAQASLLALFSGGEGYRVEENDGCLLLGWQTRPLIFTSAWKPDSNRE